MATRVLGIGTSAAASRWPSSPRPGVPSLSTIESWDTEHLQSAARYVTTTKEAAPSGEDIDLG